VQRTFSISFICVGQFYICLAEECRAKGEVSDKRKQKRRSRDGRAASVVLLVAAL